MVDPISDSDVAGLAYKQGHDSIWNSLRDKSGIFKIPWEGFSLPGFTAILKFACLSKNNSNIPSQSELDKLLPVIKPDRNKLENPPQDKVQATWIGHATVFVQLEGLNILTDPIFSDYCGPFQCFPIPKRFRKPACSIDELPRVDAVVISHNHFDHLDVSSIQQLNSRFPEISYFVPLGLRDWMVSTGCRNVQELDWWQEGHMSSRPDIKFVCTPAQHWCSRGGFGDRNKVLWGSWCVIGAKQRFYFAGDTGYCDVFKEIGRKYQPFDLAAIPIGAYEPREFMRCQHVNPAEAWKIHQDVGAKLSLGVHWGTFNLAHEFYLEPREYFDNLEGNRDPKTFITINLGETI